MAYILDTLCGRNSLKVNCQMIWVLDGAAPGDLVEFGLVNPGDPPPSSYPFFTHAGPYGQGMTSVGSAIAHPYDLYARVGGVTVVGPTGVEWTAVGAACAPYSAAPVLTAILDSPDEADLSWTAGTQCDGRYGSPTYTVKRGATTLASGLAGLTYHDSGPLAPGVYTYRIVASWTGFDSDPELTSNASNVTVTATPGSLAVSLDGARLTRT